MNIGDRARPLESERFARQLAEIGLNVAIVARRRPRLEELAHELETKNRVRVKIIAADLSQSDFYRSSFRKPKLSKSAFS